MNFTPPEPLTECHDLADFDCGTAALDDWLKRRALKNQLSDATRSFRRNMPDPIPVVILARLAIDRACQGKGLGRALFRDAALRVMQAADTIGIRGIIVHAISLPAKDFYLALGFDVSPLEPMTLTILLKDLRGLID
jgi:GNAT superfamily N-acetyltransferase